ncbi:MAG: 6-phosphofructokinase [archaeon]
MAKINIAYMMGGGATSVINLAILGIVDEAKKTGKIGKILGIWDGTEGLVYDSLFKAAVNLLEYDYKKIQDVSNTPGAALRSGRRIPSENDMKTIVKRLVDNNIDYVFYHGGNGTSLVLSNLMKYAKGTKLKCIHVPKTIDNDLVGTYFSPGYGTTAKYVALEAINLRYSFNSSPGIAVFVTMGRNAGWVAAASCAGGADLIYLPERPININKMCKQIIAKHIENLAKGIGTIVCVSEGLMNEKKEIYAEIARTELSDVRLSDENIHTPRLSSAPLDFYLKEKIKQELFELENLKYFDTKVRATTLGYGQRENIKAIAVADREVAYGSGRAAVKYALTGKTNIMVGITKNEKHGTLINAVSHNELPCFIPSHITADIEYYEGMWDYLPIPLSEIADIKRNMVKERTLPDNFINKEGNNVTPEFFNDYLKDIIGQVPEMIEFTPKPSLMFRIKKTN